MLNIYIILYFTYSYKLFYNYKNKSYHKIHLQIACYLSKKEKLFIKDTSYSSHTRQPSPLLSTLTKYSCLLRIKLKTQFSPPQYQDPPTGRI